LVYGFIHAATYSWDSPITIISFVVAAVLLTAFVIIEAVSRHPVMPLRLFSRRTRVGSYLVMLILGAAVFAMFYFLSQYVQTVKGFSPLVAGFAFLPISAVIVVVAQIVSRNIARVGAQTFIVSGTISVGLGLSLLSRLTPESSYALHVLPAIMLIAAGMGCIFVPVTLTAVSGVAPDDSGIASAMLNVGQQVGGTLGLAALVTVFSTAARHVTASEGGAQQGAGLSAQAFTHGADMAFRAGSIFAFVGMVIALVLIRPSAGEQAGGREVPSA
jgi:predicted MFS family arabinose efflux permease